MVEVVVDLLEVEVEQMSRVEGVEPQGQEGVGAAMGIGLEDESCFVKLLLSHRWPHGRSYCNRV